MGFNKLDDLVNLVFGHFNQGRTIEQKINDKYDQLTFPRVTHMSFDFFEDNIKGVVGILKHFHIVFETSDAVLCSVDVAFDVGGVAWEFGFCRVGK